ncbi:MAG: hypothetical protein Q8P67_21455 [archaeon]|nr:hypothetical protein [archaeon]
MSTGWLVPADTVPTTNNVIAKRMLFISSGEENLERCRIRPGEREPISGIHVDGPVRSLGGRRRRRGGVQQFLEAAPPNVDQLWLSVNGLRKEARRGEGV